MNQIENLTRACRQLVRHAMKHRRATDPFNRGLHTGYLTSARIIGWQIQDARRRVPQTDSWTSVRIRGGSND